MKNFILLALVIVQAVVWGDCHEYTVTKLYCSEILAKGFHYPTNFELDHASNDLYFSNKYGDREGSRKTLKLNLITKAMFQIPGVEHGVTQAINHEGKEIFVAGFNNPGIYQYDPIKNTSTLVGAEDKYIEHMFYKDVLYFTVKYENNKLYTFKNGKYSLYEDLIDTTAINFFIDKDDMMFYNNDTGFYQQQKGTKDAVLIVKGDANVITYVAFGPDGDAYVAKDGAIYFMNKESAQLEKMVELGLYYAFTVDSIGRFIYASGNDIYRLVPKKSIKC